MALIVLVREKSGGGDTTLPHPKGFTAYTRLRGHLGPVSPRVTRLIGLIDSRERAMGNAKNAKKSKSLRLSLLLLLLHTLSGGTWADKQNKDHTYLYTHNMMGRVY